jgi:DNA-binding NarL/FixJ family response regulator
LQQKPIGLPERDTVSNVGAEATGLRVLVADDSEVTRFGIKTALEQAGFRICAEAADAALAVELAVRERPDVCLLDVVMPKGGGIRAVREISEHVPETAILMLTGSEAGEDVRDALQLGAAGYILKDEKLSDIANAVRSAAAGERPMSKRAVGDLISATRTRRRHDLAASRGGEPLTDREWEVLELLAGGRSEEEVALRLGVETPTVWREAEQARHKLGAEDVPAAIAMVRASQAPD